MIKKVKVNFINNGGKLVYMDMTANLPEDVVDGDQVQIEFNECLKMGGPYIGTLNLKEDRS